MTEWLGKKLFMQDRPVNLSAGALYIAWNKKYYFVYKTLHVYVT